MNNNLIVSYAKASKQTAVLFLLVLLINAVPYWYGINYTDHISELRQGTLGTLAEASIALARSSIDTIIIMLLISNIKKIHTSIVLFLSVFWLITSYVSITFGGFDLGVLASFIETTPSEAAEYISSMHIPFQLYLVVPYFFILKKTYKIKANKKINIIILSIFLISTTPYILYKLRAAVVGGSDFNIITTITQVTTNLNVIKLIHKTNEFVNLKKNEVKPIVPAWTNVTENKNTANFDYIVIIGESAPRKSFSYYKNRDLSKLTGWEFISNAISPGVVTIESIPRILSKNKLNNINFNLNIIDLANAAGLNTYWLSNQGELGKFDTPVTVLAKRTKHSIFHNKGTYVTAGSDDRLLTDLKKILSDHKTGKLIFLHTIGSHSDFCRRTEFYSSHITNFNKKNEKSCFKDTIYNTELYIDKVNQIMSKTKLNYKIIYFSDHGLTDVSYSPYKVHGVRKLFSNAAIDIPLIFIDSTEKQKGKMINKTYYMRDFINTFADWTGINANEINHNLSIYNKGLKQESYIYQDDAVKKLL